MGGILSAWFAEVVLITYRGVKGGTTGPIKGLPLPADYVGSTIIYGGLGLLGNTKAAPVAAMIGWGLVVSTLLNLFTPKNPTNLKPAAAAQGATSNAPKTAAPAKQGATK